MPRERGFIRADVITSVSGDTESVLAVRSDTQDLVSLATGVTPGGKRKPLPAGFHVYFLQTLDEVRRDKSDLTPRPHGHTGIPGGAGDPGYAKASSRNRLRMSVSGCRSRV
ncbi:hypothetical protein BC342_10625 [Streptomyces olivaceus]|nr:hypothetical protein BC342_10625 [Streptomyces olivaceus]